MYWPPYSAYWTPISDRLQLIPIQWRILWPSQRALTVITTRGQLQLHCKGTQQSELPFSCKTLCSFTHCSIRECWQLSREARKPLKDALRRNVKTSMNFFCLFYFHMRIFFFLALLAWFNAISQCLTCNIFARAIWVIRWKDHSRVCGETAWTRLNLCMWESSLLRYFLDKAGKYRPDAKFYHNFWRRKRGGSNCWAIRISNEIIQIIVSGLRAETSGCSGTVVVFSVVPHSLKVLLKLVK